MDYKAIGRRIREKRKEHGLTQEQLAEMIDRSTSFCGHIERGTRKASASTLKAICDCLSVSMDDIVGHPFQSQPSVTQLAKELLHTALEMAETLSSDTSPSSGKKVE